MTYKIYECIFLKSKCAESVLQTFKYDFRKLLVVLCMEVILIVFELDENTDELTSAVF